MGKENYNPLSYKDRMSIRERDFRYGRQDNPTPCCQFPHDKHPDIKCQFDVQVHHILPQMFGAVYLKATIDELNTEINLISLCANSHVIDKNSLHPDQQGALDSYRQGDKQAFEKLQQLRRVQAGKGLPYHNTIYDSELYLQTRRNNAEGKAHDWRFGHPSRQFSTMWKRMRQTVIPKKAA